MCEQCAPRGGWTRRRFLAAGTGLGLAAVAGVRPAGARQTTEINPRATWATGGRDPKGVVPAEDDVRFLLVHHTVNSNTYAEDDVPGIIRSIFDFHTGPEKNWPDVAYNFMVDRFGGIWETRTLSLERAVAGDATGGNQGFDQKCAFIGDHSTEPPTPEAKASMTALLAYLADRFSIATAPGSETTFVSRGSNKHPVGSSVTTPTITGHRTMSATACPGDAGFQFVTEELPAAVTAGRAPATTTTASTTSSTTTTAPTTTTSTASSTTTEPSTTTVLAAPETAGDDGISTGLVAVGTAGVVGVGAMAAILAARNRPRGGAHLR